MAYAVGTVRIGEGDVDDTFADAANFTAVAGDCLIAISMAIVTGESVSLSDTVGGNDTWTRMETGFSGESWQIEAHYLPVASAGSCTVRSQWTGLPSYAVIYVIPVSGLTTTPFLDVVFNAQAIPGTGADAVTTGNSGTLGGQPAMLLGLSRCGPYTTNPSTGTGYTSVFVGNSIRVEHKRVTTTTADAATFTAGDDTLHLSVLVAMLESSSGATGTSNGTLAGTTGSAAGLLVQFASPVSDSALGSWLSTGANLFSVIDETAPADDNDYIYTVALGSPCRLKLASLTDPVSSVNHVMSYRLRGNGAATVSVKLYTGGSATLNSGTLVRTWTHAAMAGTLTDFAQTLSGAEADAISDYTNIFLEFAAN